MTCSCRAGAAERLTSSSTSIGNFSMAERRDDRVRAATPCARPRTVPTRDAAAMRARGVARRSRAAIDDESVARRARFAARPTAC
jgi:hypothetical protein